MMSLSNSDFRSHFRISKSNFERLLNFVGAKLASVTKLLNNLDAKLLAVLWLLSTPECYRAVSIRFKIPKGTLHWSFLRIVDVLNMNSGSFISWPSNTIETARLFQRHGLNNVIGAIGGSYIPIKMPVVNGIDYVCRKK